MKKTAWLSTIFVFLLLSRVGVKAAYAGAKLYLDPSSATKNINDTFSVTVKVDSGGEVVGGVDGIGTYDSTRLELVGTPTKASNMVFSNLDGGGSCQIGTASNGKFSFTCYANSAIDNTAVSGDLIVLTFKAKATGTASVAFSCTSGSTVDSNIVKTSTSGDIISCSENGSGSYIINDGGSSTTTTTTTSTATSTPATTKTTTELPKTGNVGATVGLVSFGLVSLLSAVFLKFL